MAENNGSEKEVEVVQEKEDSVDTETTEQHEESSPDDTGDARAQETTVEAAATNVPAPGDWPEPYEDRKPIGKYEYLDHTADVQLHSWGDTLKESFEQVALAMFDYITNVELVDKVTTEVVEAEGSDLSSLLYHFLDEWLFLFSADPFFIPREVIIDELDLENFKIVSRGIGETFDLCKHPQGTEVKAITYSNMQVFNEPPYDIYVIIDI